MFAKEILNLIFNILFAVVDILICFDLVNCFLKKRFESKRKNIFFCSLLLLVVLINYIGLYLVNSKSVFAEYERIAVTILVGLVLCHILFFGTLKEKILFFFIFYICEIVAESTYLLIMSFVKYDYRNLNFEKQLLFSVFQKVLSFIISRGFQRLFKKSKHAIEGRTLYSLIILPLVTIFIGVYLSKIEFENLNDRVFALTAVPLLVFCNILVFAVVERISSLQYEHYEFDFLKQKMQIEKEYYNHLDEIEQKQVAVRHDIKHYISVLKVLNSEKKSEEIEKLLNQFEDGMNRITPEKYTTNRILNALLSEKKAFAIKNDVEIEYMIEANIDINLLSDMDIISLFGNLIDNAIRAEKECNSEDKKIHVKLFETEGNFNVLNVRNRFLHIEKKGTDFISTKNEEGVHGIGLKNVESIAKKYGGVFSVDIEDDKSEKIFDVTVCLPKK